jgi:hypothetical protein
MGLIESLLEGAKTADETGLLDTAQTAAKYDPSTFVPTGEDWYTMFEEGTDKSRAARLAELRAYKQFGVESGDDIIANLGPKSGGYDYTTIEAGTGGYMQEVPGIYQPKLTGGRTMFTAEQEEYMNLLSWEEKFNASNK